MTEAATKINKIKIVSDATCTFCGCVCDDMELTVDLEQERITKAKNACVLGRAWFAEHVVDKSRPVATIDGSPATLKEASAVAAAILHEARCPIIYGLSDTTCEAQREAVAIGDFIKGNVDTTTSVCHGPSGIAFQDVGESTATLGEIKNRADLVIYWGGNPAESHPRHFTRYAVTPKGMFVPNGKKDRTVVLVDVRRTPSTPVADIFLRVKPGRDFELLWALRAMVKGVEVTADIEELTGISREVLEDLVERMKNCNYGVLFFGMGLTMTRGRHFNSGAVLSLAADLNDYTHFVAMPVRGHGNVTGADNVVSWQTGYPFGVNFNRGYPRFNPGEFTTVDMLARGEADTALIIATDPVANFPARSIAHLNKIPLVVLDTKETATTKLARVAFNVATYGINTGGTVYRMDNVPISLRPALASPHPGDQEVLSLILGDLRKLRAAEVRHVN